MLEISQQKKIMKSYLSIIKVCDKKIELQRQYFTLHITHGCEMVLIFTSPFVLTEISKHLIEF